ncbi:MAG: amidohydrolase family protein [Candidatus Limnocylindrales bacterium]
MRPTVVFDHVRIHEPHGSRLVDVAVRGARISAIDAAGTAAAAIDRTTAHVAGNGRSLLPGLIDPHIHLAASAAAKLSLDCGPTRVRCVGDLLEAISEAARHSSGGRWIRGVGFDESMTPERRMPSLGELDAAAPDHPVRIHHRSGHGWLVNSAALDALDELGWRPSGPRRPEATALIPGDLPPIGGFSRGEMADAFRELGEDLLRAGVTTLQDATPATAAQRCDLRDLVAGCEAFPEVSMMAAPDGEDAEVETADEGADVATVVKVLIEERLGPAEGRQRIEAGLIAAQRTGRDVAVHIVDESSLAVVLAVLREHAADGRHPARVRLEHVSICPPPLLDEIAALGCSVVTQPGFVTASGDRYRASFDGEQLDWLYPVASLRAREVPVAAASDGPYGPALGLPTIAAATSRTTGSGFVIGQREVVDRTAALEMHTVVGARVIGYRDRGTIAPGMRADLVLLDADLDAMTAHDLGAVRVERTYIAGRQVFANA